MFILMNTWAYSSYKNPTFSFREKKSSVILVAISPYWVLLSNLILIFLSLADFISHVLLLFVWNY